MEFLKENGEREYEDFIWKHPNGHFMQSLEWAKVKPGWSSDAIISRGKDGEIKGSLFVLKKKTPVFNIHYLYAPRGPVCGCSDKETFADLLEGVKALAKKCGGYKFTCDPIVPASDSNFLALMKEFGFSLNKGRLEIGYTIQPRFHYRLDINGRSADELFKSFNESTRRNIRKAIKFGVEVKVCGLEMVDEFARMMAVTGQRDGFMTRPANYFKNMFEVMGENFRLYIAFFGGRPISGAVCAHFGHVTYYIYGASDNVYRNVMPNYLMQWEMIKWAAENGSDIYDFMGISGDLENKNGPAYGLYRFKRGFNGYVAEFPGEFSIVYNKFIDRLINTATDIQVSIIRRKKGLYKKNAQHVSAETD
ncbi:MAG: peptidoglycan bridge formation glycyltransferase FemA/FemB family protein [Oscillospiraceae bacterium]|nr:peptidoglycan bridge formation glycyltransferase FemA/FemB family protein [Oscillospiraceae bacterium]